MMDGGNGNGCCGEMKIGREQLVHGREHGDCVLLSCVSRALGIRLNGCNQGDAQTGRLQSTVDAEVISAESAGPGNGDAEDGLACYFAAPGDGSLPSTAFRQRP